MRDFNDCRPYLQHLQIEHQHLHARLRQVQERLAQLSHLPDEQAAPVARFMEDLQALQGKLARHYAAEEAGGCLEEAESRCPSVTTEVKRVQAEHPELRRELDRLLAAARQIVESRQGLDGVRREFDDFASRIRQHEAAEDRIMVYGFGAGVMDDLMEDIHLSDQPCACGRQAGACAES